MAFAITVTIWWLFVSNNSAMREFQKSCLFYQNAGQCLGFIFITTVQTEKALATHRCLFLTDLVLDFPNAIKDILVLPKVLIGFSFVSVN